jgi:glutaredoxin
VTPAGAAGAAGQAGPSGASGLPGHLVTLLSRPGCHLCDAARDVIARVTADLGVPWVERDITQSEADLRDYWDKIPVTLIDGVQHDFWQVSEQRLRSALTR